MRGDHDRPLSDREAMHCLRMRWLALLVGASPTGSRTRRAHTARGSTSRPTTRACGGELDVGERSHCYRDVAIELGVAADVKDAKAILTELGQDLVSTDA